MRRKLTNWIWRSLRESVVIALFLIAAVLYTLDSFSLIDWPQQWLKAAQAALALIAIGLAVGLAYGLWHSLRVKERLDKLHDLTIAWEKGNLSQSLPADLNGEDEFGQLGNRLQRIGKMWESQVTSLQRLSTHNAELAEKAKLSAIVEERQRLARELHDAVSQQLFAISMTATAVRRGLEKDPVKAARQIALIEEMASVAQSEMRALLLHLRPVHLDGKRLAEALTELMEELRLKVPMEMDWSIEDDLRLPKGIEDHLFRIVQEALSNALRHSKANRLEVSIHTVGDGEVLRLTVRDDGVGFELDDKKWTSYGMVTMRERVSEIGGTIQILTAPGQGTRLDIRVPLHTGAKEETGDDGEQDD